jgi:hypothetical protein
MPRMSENMRRHFWGTFSGAIRHIFKIIHFQGQKNESMSIIWHSKRARQATLWDIPHWLIWLEINNILCNCLFFFCKFRPRTNGNSVAIASTKKWTGWQLMKREFKCSRIWKSLLMATSRNWLIGEMDVSFACFLWYKINE